MIRDVVGYDGLYLVSDCGAVFNAKGKKLIPYDNGYGYLIVDLYKDKRKKHARIHRLVAEAFLPNPNALPEVNHKDENKHNNSVANLEWCTSSYNKCYGHGRTSRSIGMKKIWMQRRATDD